MLQRYCRLVVIALLIALTFSVSGCWHGRDSDWDGVSDSREEELGTDPYDWDTDGDHLSDGYEAAQIYDLAGAPGRVISSTYSGIATIHTVDLDSDGDIDVVTGTFGDDTLGWHENFGQGVFGARQVLFTGEDIDTVGVNIHEVTSGDVDGDGDPDLFFVSPDRGEYA